MKPEFNDVLKTSVTTVAAWTFGRPGLSPGRNRPTE